ncbi:MAG: diacylglycerol kinase family protein [Erythrobacter sp.]|jgi:hypothetical protein|nr:diacylglycerol kinase family protein [Erythrobacter sp.]
MATPIYQFTRLPAAVTAATNAASAPRSRAPGERPRVGVIYNPRSHRNHGTDFDCGLSPQVHIAQPGEREQLPSVLADFAAAGIDLLVINGGDGTVRDVLTSGVPIFGDDWPAIAVLPKGKTNALTIDLGLPSDWTLEAAIAAFERGGRTCRRPIDITEIQDPADRRAPHRVRGFILGAGAFTTATRAGQSAHRLGVFNALAVGMTAAWAVGQWLFASRANPYRRGAPMRITLGAHKAAMAHSGQGDPGWRQMLFASTLERLPAGLAPFGKLKTGLKLVALDQIDRRRALLIPRILRGKTPSRLRERGIHQIATPEFTLALGDAFILDGEAFPPGEYRVSQGPPLAFVTP